MKAFITLLSILLFCSSTYAKKPYRTEYYKSGKVKATYTRTKEKAVKVVYFYENGQVEQSGYSLRGRTHGTWVHFDEHGTKLASAFFVNGKRNGQWHYFDGANGRLKYTINFKEDRARRYAIWDSKGDFVAYELQP